MHVHHYASITIMLLLSCNPRLNFVLPEDPEPFTAAVWVSVARQRAGTCAWTDAGTAGARLHPAAEPWVRAASGELEVPQWVLCINTVLLLDPNWTLGSVGKNMATGTFSEEQSSFLLRRGAPNQLPSVASILSLMMKKQNMIMVNIGVFNALLNS